MVFDEFMLYDYLVNILGACVWCFKVPKDPRLKRLETQTCKPKRTDIVSSRSTVLSDLEQ